MIVNSYAQTALHTFFELLALSLMQAVDVAFVRDLGKDATAIVGISTAYFAWFLILGLGLTSALEFLIPKARGEGRADDARSFYETGYRLSIFIGLLSGVLFSGLMFFSNEFGIPSEIASDVKWFSTILACSYPFAFSSNVLRVKLQALGRAQIITQGMIAANLLNILFNGMFVLGWLGFPALGILGSATATLLSRISLNSYYQFKLKQLTPAPTFKWTADHAEILLFKRILKLGLPSSLHFLFEMGAFIIVGMMAARLPTEQSAAHTIALSVASMVFMVPLGISSAAAVTISRALGEQNQNEMRKLAWLSIRIGLMYALCSGLIIIVFRDFFLSLFTTDPSAIAVGRTLLFWAAVFQLGDAMQVILAGVLRGMGYTRIQPIVNGIGHALIGLPLAFTLANQTPLLFTLKIEAYWIGLSSGLFAVALGLGFYFQKVIRKPSLILRSE